MSDKDGGPAFPAPARPKTDWTLEDVTSGMTLRDYFAAKAMPVVMDTMPDAGNVVKNADPDLLAQAIGKTVARWSYALADAMLAERQK